MSSQAGPPGFDDSTPVVADAKPKTKSVKRNERKKEKRLQVCLVALSCACKLSCVDWISSLGLVLQVSISLRNGTYPGLS